ncbi:unnamed protein product [Somion occarium]|uniref:Uncharacterized protein n=1 Tax=Somion occarium TaxID=3059160 RepID=A0ABP1DJK3_9APHY
MQTQSSAASATSSQCLLPADFTFSTIGKPPSLLRRLTDQPVDVGRSPSPLSQKPVKDKPSPAISSSGNSPALSSLSERLGNQSNKVESLPLAGVSVNTERATFGVPGRAAALVPNLSSGSARRSLPISTLAASTPLAPQSDSIHSGQSLPSVQQPSYPSTYMPSQLAPDAGVTQPFAAQSADTMEIDASAMAPVARVPSPSHSSNIVPHVTADDLYAKLASLANERTAWDDIRHHFQRCRDEREELLRRHDETVRAAQREKEQADRVLDAAEAAFKLVESLRDKQEQRWEQEKLLAERAYAETLRQQQQDTAKVKIRPSTQTIEVPSAPSVSQRPSSQVQSPPPASTATGSAPANPTATGSTHSYSSPSTAPSTTTVAVRQMSPTGLKADIPAKPVIAEVKSHGSIPTQETPEQPQKREELERLQAEKKAQIQARKRKEQAEEGARIRALRATGGSTTMESKEDGKNATPAKSKSATPLPSVIPSQAPHGALSLNVQRLGAVTQSIAPTAVVSNSVQIASPIVQSPTVMTSSSTASVTSASASSHDGTRMKMKKLLPISTSVTSASTSQPQSPVEPKTPATNAPTSKVTMAAKAAAANLPPKPPPLGPPLKKASTSPSDSRSSAQIAMPIPRPQATTKPDSATASPNVRVKQEPLPDVLLSCPKTTQGKQPAQTLSTAPELKVAPSTSSISYISNQTTQIPPQNAQQNKRATQPASDFNVRDRDRSGRDSGPSSVAEASTSISSNSAAPSGPKTITISGAMKVEASSSGTKQLQQKRQKQPQQQRKQIHQPASNLPRSTAIKANDDNAEPTRHPPPPSMHAAIELDPWMNDPRFEGGGRREPWRSPERSPSPPRRSPAHDHYSLGSASGPATRSRAPRRGRADHYSPPASPDQRSLEYSPNAEANRKRPRDSDLDWSTSEQPPRRARVSGPTAKSPDWGAPSQYRQSLADSRDLARTPPMPPVEDYPRGPAGYGFDPAPAPSYMWSAGRSDNVLTVVTIQDMDMTLMRKWPLVPITFLRVLMEPILPPIIGKPPRDHLRLLKTDNLLVATVAGSHLDHSSRVANPNNVNKSQICCSV